MSQAPLATPRLAAHPGRAQRRDPGAAPRRDDRLAGRGRVREHHHHGGLRARRRLARRPGPSLPAQAGPRRRGGRAPGRAARRGAAREGGGAARRRAAPIASTRCSTSSTEAFGGPLFDAALELWVAARTDAELHRSLYQFERVAGRGLAPALARSRRRPRVGRALRRGAATHHAPGARHGAPEDPAQR